MERIKLYISTLFLLFFLNASAQDAIYTSESIAPGWTKLSFDAPEPSTYTLAKYAPAGNGNVLDADGSINHFTTYLMIKSFYLISCIVLVLMSMDVL
ncbi:MAG: hypothetical protein CM15mP63_2820 [Gammaproteobacteria bacterium]|nr:MAG: hypothetical protein CM15mP63_2820 [Gammaproteobacteria bacterium]